MDRSLFQDEVEMSKHEEAIARLCDEFPDQCEMVSKIYEENLEPMIAEASIRTYLPIFISRKVKDGLLSQH